MVRLDPERYQCPDHEVDITYQVEEALDESYYRSVAYGGLQARPGPFEVIVTCPGAGQSGQHKLTCTGTWSR